MAMTPVVYLAGPMTGYHHWNFPSFFRASALLEAYGVEVINPAQHDLDNGFDPETPNHEFTEAQRHEAMAWDLHQVLSAASAVVYLPGSSESRGASLEMDVAKAVGKTVVPLSIALARLALTGTIHDSW